jgi:hypothetical protein
MVHLELIAFMPATRAVLTMIFYKKLFESAEDYSYQNRISTRNEAIRQPLERGLKQYDKETKK